MFNTSKVQLQLQMNASIDKPFFVEVLNKMKKISMRCDKSWVFHTPILFVI